MLALHLYSSPRRLSPNTISPRHLLCVGGERHAAEHPCRPPLGRLDLHEGGPPLALAVVPLAANGRGGSPSHNVERIFTPTDDGNSHKNIYHFEDERGTVSEGRMCGPWYMTQEMSPTLAWCTRSLPSADAAPPR